MFELGTSHRLLLGPPEAGRCDRGTLGALGTFIGLEFHALGIQHPEGALPDCEGTCVPWGLGCISTSPGEEEGCLALELCLKVYCARLGSSHHLVYKMLVRWSVCRGTMAREPGSREPQRAFASSPYSLALGTHRDSSLSDSIRSSGSHVTEEATDIMRV